MSVDSPVELGGCVAVHSLRILLILASAGSVKLDGHQIITFAPSSLQQWKSGRIIFSRTVVRALQTKASPTGPCVVTSGSARHSV
jgi:hypothetical protein